MAERGILFTKEMRVCEITGLECEFVNDVDCDPPECQAVHPSQCPSNEREVSNGSDRKNNQKDKQKNK